LYGCNEKYYINYIEIESIYKDQHCRSVAGEKSLAFTKFLTETVPKINVVVLQPTKNLHILPLTFSLTYLLTLFKKEIIRTKVLRMTRKGKFTKILEHSQFITEGAPKFS
jgi:hypothetical protein